METIKLDEKSQPTNFFGFCVSDTPEKETSFITDSDEGIVLHIQEKNTLMKETINWFDYFSSKQSSVTENEIWAWILEECQKRTHATIFISRQYVEEVYIPLANCFYQNQMKNTKNS